MPCASAMLDRDRSICHPIANWFALFFMQTHTAAVLHPDMANCCFPIRHTRLLFLIQTRLTAVFHSGMPDCWFFIWICSTGGFSFRHARLMISIKHDQLLFFLPTEPTAVFHADMPNCFPPLRYAQLRFLTQASTMWFIMNLASFALSIRPAFWSLETNFNWLL